MLRWLIAVACIGSTAAACLADPPVERFKLTLVKSSDKEITVDGGGACIYRIATAPDGKHILLGGDESSPIASLWNVETGTTDQFFDVFDPQREGSPFNVAIAPDGKRAAFVTTWNKLCLLDVGTSSISKIVDRPLFVIATEYSKDGKLLLLFDLNGGLTAVSATEGAEEFQLRGHHLTGTGLAFSPDGKRLATSSGDATARIWDFDRRREIHLLQHDHWVWAVAFSPDGKLVATGTGGSPEGNPLQQNFTRIDDNAIRLWNADTGKLVRTLDGHTHAVQCLRFVHGGKRLVSGGFDGSLRLWDVATGGELSKYEGKSWIVSLAVVGPQERIVAGGGSRRENKMWSHLPEERLRVFRIEPTK